MLRSKLRNKTIFFGNCTLEQSFRLGFAYGETGEEIHAKNLLLENRYTEY